MAEAVANYNVTYHKALTDYLQNKAIMKDFYTVMYEGPNKGTTFRAIEAWTASGVAHEIGEGDDPWQGEVSPGYGKDVTVYQRTYSISMTWFFQYHNKYQGQEQKLISDAALATMERLEFDLSAPFTYCTSTAYTNIDGRSVDITTGDGVCPASASHALLNSSSSCRNLVANGPQLSAGALELAQDIGKQQILDNNGTPLMVTYTDLVVNNDQATYNVAMKLMKSYAPTDAPNSGVHNPFMGVFRVRQAFYIDRTFSVGGKAFTFDSTKKKQWMLIDSSNKGMYLWVTQYPTVMPPQTAQLNYNKTWAASAVYEPIVVDWRGFVISTADGNG